MGNTQSLARLFNLPPVVKPRKPSETLKQYQYALDDLLEGDPAEFGKRDLATLNLLCAPNLVGSENLDIPRCLARLDKLVAHVKATTERNLYRAARDPDYSDCEPKWRMGMLVTCVKLDFGAAYDPVVKADLQRDGHSPFIDSRNVFIHGLLADNHKRRWGSCSSLPVLVTAVARRLGYPVRLAKNRRHIWARWDDGQGLIFNIEASNPAGMTVESDEHYLTKMFGPLNEVEMRSGLYCRSLNPAEEFALFLKSRVWCLTDMKRPEETLHWSARALQLSPDDPHFSKCAYDAAILALRKRFQRKNLTQPLPSDSEPHQLEFKLNELLSEAEASRFLTIGAHWEESDDDLGNARKHFEDACRLNPYGDNEQRDLQRFLRKYNLPRRNGPVLPPRFSLPRFFKLLVKPHEEADALRWMIDKFEGEGAMLNARKAMIDLYMFDPCDAELFQRLRMMERHPKFQIELKEDHKRRGVITRPRPEI
jgi:hypothetical protein